MQIKIVKQFINENEKPLAGKARGISNLLHMEISYLHMKTTTFNISDTKGVHQHVKPFLQNNNGEYKAVKTLYKVGFNFVLLDGKKPIHCGYKQNPPDLKELIYHKGQLGIVPDSASDYPLIGLDVDFGNPKDLPLPFAKYPTKRGWHYYYFNPDSHRNQLATSMRSIVKASG